MKDFIYTEKFDNYLKGKLEPDDRSSVEEEIRQDPLLLQETSLQKDIYQVLGAERRLLLKSRLDKVAVNTGSLMNFTGAQWAAILGSVLLITSAGYYGLVNFQEKDTEIAKVDIVSQEEISAKSQAEELPHVPLPVYNEKEPDDAGLMASTQDKLAVVAMPKAVEVEGRVNQENKAIPKIVLPDIMTEFEEEDQTIDYSDFNAPDKTLLEKSEAISSGLAIETIADQRYDFHYQMIDQKLYLYGDFQGIPYKIISLNRNERKQLFLKFQDDFYNLNQEQIEVVPLDLIQDSTIIKALRALSH